MLAPTVWSVNDMAIELNVPVQAVQDAILKYECGPSHHVAGRDLYNEAAYAIVREAIVFGEKPIKLIQYNELENTVGVTPIHHGQVLPTSYTIVSVIGLRRDCGCAWCNDLIMRIAHRTGMPAHALVAPTAP